MTEATARAIYRKGLEATVQALTTLAAENARLQADNEELQARLRASTTVSPTTPSGAVPPYQKPNAAAGRRRREPGRKKGHTGVARKAPEHIDRTVTHAPLAHCPECNGPVAAEPSEGRERIIEGLVRMAAETVRHCIPRHYCPRCQKLVEPVVTDAMPGARISLHVYVLGAWLHYGCGMSVAKLVALCQHAGLPISPGALTQGWQRLAALVEPAYDQILERVKGSLVLMADETGWRIRGVTHWLWYFGSRFWSYYVIDRRRRTAVVKRVIGEVFDGVLLADFWGAYNAIETWAKQRCVFHLFTALKHVDIQRPGDALWRSFRQRLKRIFQDAVRLLEQRHTLDPPTVERRRRLLDQRLDTLLAEPSPHREVRRLHKRLRRHRNELFTFLDYAPLVSPYNNHAEQQMRGPVISRRISQGNRSQGGAQAQAVLMSLFRSMELQGRNPIDEVLRLAQAAIARKPLVLALAPNEADQQIAA
jgi:hypothetical protein